MRKVLLFLAAAGLLLAVNGSSLAALTIDGSILDWPAGSIYTDATNDGPAGGAEVTRWGYYYGGASASDHNYLYYFVELDQDISNYTEAYPGVWMDLDHYTGVVTQENTWYRIKENGLYEYRLCYQGPSVARLSTHWTNTEWIVGGGAIGGELQLGTDILAEMSWNGGEGPTGYNYWGWMDCMGAYGTDAAGFRTIREDAPIMRYPADGLPGPASRIFEGRIPIDHLVADVKVNGDYSAGWRNGDVSGLWQVGMRAVAYPTSYAVDVAPTVYIPIIGDFDNDSDCDLDDFAVLAVGFGSGGLAVPGTTAHPGEDNSSWESGDGDLDGDVDLDDFAFLAVTFGKDINTLGTGGAVPEPVTLTLLAIGGLLLRRRR